MEATPRPHEDGLFNEILELYFPDESPIEAIEEIVDYATHGAFGYFLMQMPHPMPYLF